MDLLLQSRQAVLRVAFLAGLPSAAAGSSAAAFFAGDRLAGAGLEAAFDAITSPGSASLMPEATTLAHYQAFATPTDPFNRGRMALRRSVRRAVDHVTRGRE